MINNITKNDFYNLAFDEKTKSLKRYLLLNSKFKINDMVMCFEDRALTYDEYYGGLSKKGPDKIQSLTVGVVYKILDIRISNGSKKIKVKSDQNKPVWISPKRFLGSMALRKQKLQALESKKDYRIITE